MGHAFADFTHPDDIDQNREDLRRLKSGEAEVLLIDKRYIRKDGQAIWTNVSSTLIGDADGQPSYALTAVQDITDRKLAEQHQRLLIDELNHRVKNMLTTVQAIAMQTFRGSGSGELQQAMFQGRLLALSNAHSLLMRENWTGVGLRDLALQATEPFGGGDEDAGCISLDGDDVRLKPNVALALGMAFHELGTNAVKHGALSVSTGGVLVRWRCERSPEGDRLRIAWEERGGPTVEPPRRKGFGSRLIERGLGRETGGVFQLNYDPAGVSCVIDLPRPNEE